MSGKVRVTGFVSRGRERRTRVGEDGCGIRPVEEKVQQYTEKGRCVAFKPGKSQQSRMGPFLPLSPVNSPVQALRVGKKPIPASTQIAHVVRPYTNPRGKYVTTLQQYLSHFRAQLFRRRMVGGGDGDVDRPRVAMPQMRIRDLLPAHGERRKARECSSR